MKRIMFLILAVMLVITMLSGCGETADSTTASPVPAEDTAVEEAKEPESTATPIDDTEEEFDEENCTFTLEGVTYGEPEPITSSSDLPGMDMSAYVGKIVKIKDYDFYVISVDENSPSKAFCLLVYPRDGSSILPKIDITVDWYIKYNSEDGDYIPFAKLPKDISEEDMRYAYVGSYVDQIANKWAEESGLADYMLETNVGIGDRLDLYCQPTDGEKFPEFFCHYPQYDSEYTAYITRKAYAMSVEEAKDINMDHFLRPEVNFETRHACYWLRTSGQRFFTYEWKNNYEPYRNMAIWDFAPLIPFEGGGQIGNSQYVIENESGDYWSYQHYFELYNANHNSTTRYSIRPAIVCNLYNLTPNMVKLNEELMPFEDIDGEKMLPCNYDVFFVDAEGNPVDIAFTDEDIDRFVHMAVFERVPVIEALELTKFPGISHEILIEGSLPYENCCTYASDKAGATIYQPINKQLVPCYLHLRYIPEGYVSRAGDVICLGTGGDFKIVLEKESDVNKGILVDENLLVQKGNNLGHTIKYHRGGPVQ